MVQAVTTSPPAEGDPRGRPLVFDERLRGEVIGLITAGVSQRKAAAYVGIDHSTISKAVERDEDFARDMAKARAAAHVHPLLCIVAASQTQWRAAAHLLKRKRPEFDDPLDEEDEGEDESQLQETAEEDRASLERTAERAVPPRRR